MRRRVRRYRASDDPEILYNPSLVDALREDRQAFDLVVRTLGERSVVDGSGPAARTIYGWRPTDREIEALSRFGEVGFVGGIATSVSVRGVARGDLASVAALPFVLEMTRDPPLAVDRDSPDASGRGTPASELRGGSYFRFSELPSAASIPSWLRIGIVDRGYGGAGAFRTAHAEEMGIDGDLARDFTDEGGWRTGDDHGSDVANTCAYMLPDGHDRLFVPLKVVPTRRTPSRGEVRDNVRAAIEYAEKEGIAVLNLSLGTDRSLSTCPSAYCAELYSYADAGFLPFAAIGNRDADGVEFPGGERCTIGVGGVAGSCDDGRQVARYVGEDGYYGSSFGSVRYHDPVRNRTYCHYCRYLGRGDGGFSPSVYGSYLTLTDAGETLAGTSFAAPQAAAAGAVVLGNDPGSFEDVAAAFRGMDRVDVCPDEAAGAGQLLDAEYAHRVTAGEE